MGCFSNCFGKSKRHQRRCRRRSFNTITTTTTTTTTTPRRLLEHLQKYESIEEFQVSKLIEEVETVKLTDSSHESSEEKREKVSSSERKKVTFNLDVKVYEHLPREDHEEEEEEEEKSNALEINEEKRQGDENEANRRKDDNDFETQSSSNSSSSSLFSYPPNHRYQNCRDSDDEFDEVMSSEESDIDDDDDDDLTDDEDYDYDYDYGGEKLEKEAMNNDRNVSSESLFSLSIDSRKHNLVAEVGEKEVNSPIIPSKNPTSNDSNRYDRAMYEESVLNPVENVSQWKVIKARSRKAVKDKNSQAKENIDDIGKDFEFGVDTSLSTWLVGSEPATPNSRNSSVSVGNPVSEKAMIPSPTGSHYPQTDSYDRKTVSPNKFEDRPILGALTIEEIRQFSASSSPRKSPRQSPDDMPIIGSVGSYWNHTGQQTNDSGSSIKSRSRLTESTKVVWDPTPFETRLEKALEQGMTQAH